MTHFMTICVVTTLNSHLLSWCDVHSLFAKSVHRTRSWVAHLWCAITLVCCAHQITVTPTQLVWCAFLICKKCALHTFTSGTPMVCDYFGALRTPDNTPTQLVWCAFLIHKVCIAHVHEWHTYGVQLWCDVHSLFTKSVHCTRSWLVHLWCTTTLVCRAHQSFYSVSSVCL